MVTYGFLTLSLAAIAVMGVALVMVFRLRRQVAGGTVGATWRFLSGLVVFFTVGYLTTPFFPLLPQELRDLIVGFIFLFGAIFVVIVVRLFRKVATDLGL